MFYVFVNKNSKAQHVIQIKNGTMINVNAPVKSIVRVKKIIVGILAHAFEKILSI